jgi:hypothetical protein
MKKVLVLFLFAVVLVSCQKSKNLSDIPKITFNSLTTSKLSSGLDSTAVLNFDYEDGDGNIGSLLENPPPEYRNLFVSFFQLKNGVWNEPVLPVGFDGVIPNLTPKAKDKAISGDITYNLILPPGAKNDTIRFTVYIVDRLNNKSNVITTSELVINTP